MEERGGRGQRRLFERLAQAPGHVAVPKDVISAMVNAVKPHAPGCSLSVVCLQRISEIIPVAMHAHVHICADAKGFFFR